MKIIMGNSYYTLVDYLDSCRSKRSITDYDYVGAISGLEAKELIEEAEKFLEITINWLKKIYKVF